jgi:hypothetical protein
LGVACDRLLPLFSEQPGLQPVEVDIDDRRRIEGENLRQSEAADDNANGEAPRWHAGGGASAIEEAERQNAGAHASALRRGGDGDDLKGAAEFASPAQMRASERTLRASRKTRQQGILTFPERTSLIAVYESSSATINRPTIESVSRSRITSAWSSPHFLSPQHGTDAWKAIL